MPAWRKAIEKFASRGKAGRFGRSARLVRARVPDAWLEYTRQTGDPQAGSLVLKSLTALAPDLPVVLVRGYDEPFTLYGLLARTVETDADRTYVTFAIDPAAR